MCFIKRIIYPPTIAMVLICSPACKKYLDAKSDQRFELIESVEDMQALLDDYREVNERNPSAGEVTSDDYYLSDADYQALPDFERNKYIWDNERQFPTGAQNDWSFAYQNVYKANLVLANADVVERTPGDEQAWETAKGHALFLRGQAFLQVAAIWAEAYDEATAASELGIPLRLDPDFNKRVPRANLQQTYEQIIKDLAEAASLLPEASVHVLRPSKPAAYGMLARAYLFMRKYELSGQFADKALQSKEVLTDFNTLNPEQDPIFPFDPRFSNQEIISESHMVMSPALFLTTAKIDSSLYNSYEENDLRKMIYFRDNHDETYGFRGSYTGTPDMFDGIATDELYLIRAESHARNNRVTEAMNDLNTLLVTRWKTDPVTNITTYEDRTAANAEDALNIILAERRKELLMRGLRWMDIKRLNKEGANIKLTRIIDGNTYELLPGAPGFELAIPEDVVEVGGLTQNPK